MVSEERRQLAEGGGVGEEFSVLPALYFFSVVVFNMNLFLVKSKYIKIVSTVLYFYLETQNPVKNTTTY